MSIGDVDATLAPAGVYDVTLSATQGTLTLTTLTGLTFGTGDGTDDTTMTFHGTLADINTALATAKYTPTANYNGPAQIQPAGHRHVRRNRRHRHRRRDQRYRHRSPSPSIR